MEFCRLALSAFAISLVSSMLLTVLLPLSAHAANSLPTGITALTKEKFYVPGQTVNIIGQMHSYSPVYKAMMVTVFDPDNQPYLAMKPEIGNPFFDFSFGLDKQVKEGQWTAVIRYAADVGEAKFTVTNSGLHKAVLGKPVMLSALGDQMAPEECKAGKSVQISADLDNDSEESQQFVFIVQVDDARGMPVSSSFVLGSMAPLETANPAINWTPAAGGTYTVKVFAWSSLTSPVPLTEGQVGTFEVFA